MKQTHIILTLSILFSFVVFDNIALCWDNKITHMQLSEYAADNSVLDKSQGDYLRNLGFVGSLAARVKWGEEKSIKKWLTEGARLEDAGGKIDALTGKARFNNHFHNPLKPWDEAGQISQGLARPW